MCCGAWWSSERCRCGRGRRADRDVVRAADRLHGDDARLGEPARPPLDPALEALLERCLPYYEKLRENKIEIGVPNGPG